MAASCRLPRPPQPRHGSLTRSRYSDRSASIGSTVVARQAGPRHATTPATTNAAPTATNVNGSSRLRVEEVRRQHPRRDGGREDADGESGGNERESVTDDHPEHRAARLAPSAIRTPNSCVRCDTEVAITPVIPAIVTSSASSGEHGQQHRRQLRRGEVAIPDLVERADVLHRHVRIERPRRVANHRWPPTPDRRSCARARARSDPDSSAAAACRPAPPQSLSSPNCLTSPTTPTTVDHVSPPSSEIRDPTGSDVSQ